MQRYSNAISDFAPLILACTSYYAACRRRIGNLASALEDVQPGRNETQSLKSRRSIKHKEISRFALLNTISILNAQSFRGVCGDQVQYIIDLFVSTHMA